MGREALIVFSHDIAQILTRKRSVRTFPYMLTCEVHVKARNVLTADQSSFLSRNACR